MAEPNQSDEIEVPARGVVEGPGFLIDWRVAKADVVLSELIEQYRFLQDHPVGDPQYAIVATRHLGGAAEQERKRNADREKRGVRGTKKP
jgi:hypothetical protein